MNGDRRAAVDTTALAVASVAVPLEPGINLPAHNHPQHQLTWAPGAPFTIEVDNLRWVVERSRALWIPGDMDHAVVPHSSSEMLSLYFEPDSCPLHWEVPTVVDATGLVGPLLSHLVELGTRPGTGTRTATGAGTVEHLARVTAVLWDLLKPLSIAAIPTLLPTDPLALRIALAIRQDPADPRDLEDWSREVGASVRTLSRRFRTETGTSFSSWRTYERLNSALPMLGMGQPVSRVAHAVGYATASAFITAFRREMGTTPAAYFGGSGPPTTLTETPAPTAAG